MLFSDALPFELLHASNHQKDRVITHRSREDSVIDSSFIIADFAYLRLWPMAIVKDRAQALALHNT